MFGVVALIAFVLAWFFHAAGFHPSAWIDSASMLYLGLAFLAGHLTFGVALPLIRRQPPAAR